MLTIRLTRKGKKNQPFFRIVVIDKRRSAKGGRAVEELGYVNPLTKKNSLEKERILHWLKVGAKASPRVHNLLVSEKVIDAKKINVFKLKKKSEAVSSGAVKVAVPPKEAKTEEVKAIEEPKKVEKSAEPEKPAESPKNPSYINVLLCDRKNAIKKGVFAIK
jgi:small subunit ribosomal protein S16